MYDKGLGKLSVWILYVQNKQFTRIMSVVHNVCIWFGYKFAWCKTDTKRHSFSLYREDIKRLCEDKDFIFEWRKQYFTNELSEWVKYWCHHEKIKLIASSHRVIFFLLYRFNVKSGKRRHWYRHQWGYRKYVTAYLPVKHSHLYNKSRYYWHDYNTYSNNTSFTTALVADEGKEILFSPSPFLISSNLAEEDGVCVWSFRAKQNIVFVNDCSFLRLFGCVPSLLPYGWIL